MPFAFWPASTAIKHLDDVVEGEIFRYGANKLGTVFGKSRDFPWANLINLQTFELTTYEALGYDAPDVYSLGSNWSLRLGGYAADLSVSRTLVPGCVLVDERGLLLMTQSKDSIRGVGLFGERYESKLSADVDRQLPKGLIFDEWSLLSREHSAATFETTRLDFKATRPPGPTEA